MTSLPPHYVSVTWLDSNQLHDHADTPDLPEPTAIQTVGWLSKEEEDYIVISRDRSPTKNQYEWRSSVAIPCVHIISKHTLHKNQDAKD